jgi:dihydrofolate reductase
LNNPDWESAKLATQEIEEEILDLKQQPGKDISVDRPSLIVAAMNLNLVDEYQLCAVFTRL